MATKPTRFAQMGDTTEKVKAYVGIPKQLVVDTSKWKIHLMDGATPGGYEVAMTADVTAGLAQKVDIVTYNAGLAQKVDTSELETALKELIVEFGGQVPA
nr:MAG TPA_asm: major tropism determinant [Caudoviricetes sp.]